MCYLLQQSLKEKDAYVGCSWTWSQREEARLGQEYPVAEDKAGYRTQIAVLQIVASLHQATMSPWSIS